MDLLSELLNFISQAEISGIAAYATILGVLLLCGFGVPIPEDITLITAGILASFGDITLTGAILTGFAGVLLGDSIIFFAGRKYGHNVFSFPGLRNIMTPTRVTKAEKRINKYAHFICFIARFLPGLRAPIFVIVGTMQVRPAVFFFQDGFAALISVPVWVYVGYWFSQNIFDSWEKIKGAQMYILLAVVLSAILYFLMKKKWNLNIFKRINH